MPSTVRCARRLLEVRHPRAHEVEHLAVDAELVVERTDRGDGAVVDVGDEPRHPVERVVATGIGAVEEPRRETDLGHGGESTRSRSGQGQIADA